MFCPHCGVKIENPDQRFCKNCGSELTEISEELKKISHLPRTPQDLGVEFIQQRPIKKNGPYSKRTLGFGIASLAIGGLTFMNGFNYITLPYANYFPRFVPSVFIILSIFHIAGLIFGIASKINNQQARELESINTFIKVGNVLGIIGIISNTILMVISFVIIGLLW